MLLTHSFNTRYLLKDFSFFFFWDITQKYHENFVYVLVVMQYFPWLLLITKESYLQIIRTWVGTI